MLDLLSVQKKYFYLLLVASCLFKFGPASAASDGSTEHSISSFDKHTPIPHSTVSQSQGKGIVRAMLACATDRYAHGVLGDAIESGCLIVEDDLRTVYQLDLPAHQVFEDLVPRIADMDGDGRNDVVLVRSDSRGGAALSIYTLSSGAQTQIVELAATPPIGTANRWLAPIGIADFNHDGTNDIAYIQTPHIGGILKVWSMVDNNFQQIAEASGYSNHRIGATRVSTAKLQDYNSDGVIDIALPDQRRQNTVWITLHPEIAIVETTPYQQSHFD